MFLSSSLFSPFLSSPFLGEFLNIAVPCLGLRLIQTFCLINENKKERMGKVIISPTTQDIENIISNKEKLVRVGGGHGEGAGKGGFHPPTPALSSTSLPFILPLAYPLKNNLSLTLLLTHTHTYTHTHIYRSHLFCAIFHHYLMQVKYRSINIPL